MGKMQLFTELEFNSEEFEEIPRVLHFLGNEGWEILKEQSFSTHPILGEEKIVAKKYYFKRNI